MFFACVIFFTSSFHQESFYMFLITVTSHTYMALRNGVFFPLWSMQLPCPLSLCPHFIHPAAQIIYFLILFSHELILFFPVFILFSFTPLVFTHVHFPQHLLLISPKKILFHIQYLPPPLCQYFIIKKIKSFRYKFIHLCCVHVNRPLFENKPTF